MDNKKHDLIKGLIKDLVAEQCVKYRTMHNDKIENEVEQLHNLLSNESEDIIDRTERTMHCVAICNSVVEGFTAEKHICAIIEDNFYNLFIDREVSSLRQMKEMLLEQGFYKHLWIEVQEKIILYALYSYLNYIGVDVHSIISKLKSNKEE